ncbi:hypothetical protein GOP47_0009355 [Adiantum capillus-veneris]|uniref:Uncharacterized protein n=1 Tax=Adiantum capillus-veneris TaxID=13818 RepID=A0A9D4ZH52_ADICA|nr:hypothetical protein GOP47_0009355 [Adiantum capillus-veneris]
MASRKTCAITKALLRVRLSEGSATPASAICKLPTRPQRSSALGSACRPLNAMRCMQGVRFYARLRDAPSRQPLQSAPVPSVSHDDEDDDDNDDDDDDDNHDDDDVEEKDDDADKGKEQKKRIFTCLTLLPRTTMTTSWFASGFTTSRLSTRQENFVQVLVVGKTQLYFMHSP